MPSDEFLILQLRGERGRLGKSNTRLPHWEGKGFEALLSPPHISQAGTDCVVQDMLEGFPAPAHFLAQEGFNIRIKRNRRSHYAS